MGVKISSLTQVLPTATDLFPVVYGSNTRATTLKNLYDGIRHSTSICHDLSGLWIMSGSGQINHDFRVRGHTTLGTNYDTRTNVLGNLWHSGMQLFSSGEGIFKGDLTTSGTLRAIGTLTTRHDLLGNLYVSGSGTFEDHLQVGSLKALNGNVLGGSTTIGTDASSINTVYGSSYYNDPVYLLDTVTSEGLIRQKAKTEFQNDVFVLGDLSGYGDVIFGNSVTDKLTNRGKTFLRGDSQFGSNAYFSGNLYTLGQILCTGGLTVSSDLIIENIINLSYDSAMAQFIAPPGGEFEFKNSDLSDIITMPDAGWIYVWRPISFAGQNIVFWSNTYTSLFKSRYNSELGYHPTNCVHKLIGQTYIHGNIDITGNLHTENLNVSGYVLGRYVKYAFISGLNYDTGPDVDDGIKGLDVKGHTGIGGDLANYCIMGHGFEVGDSFDCNSTLAGYGGVKTVVSITDLNEVRAQLYYAGTPAAGSFVSEKTYLRTVGTQTYGIRGAQRISRGQYVVHFDPAFPVGNSDRYVTLFSSYTAEPGVPFGGASVGLGGGAAMPTVYSQSGSCLGVFIMGLGSYDVTDKLPGFFVRCEKFK